MGDHGKAGTYNRGCRCTFCTEANLVYHEQLHERLAKRAAEGDPGVPHGTAGGYKNWDCRCIPCTAANTAASVSYYHRRRQSQGIEP